MRTAKKLLRRTPLAVRIKISGHAGRHESGNAGAAAVVRDALAHGERQSLVHPRDALPMPVDLIHVLIGVVFAIVWAMVGRIVATGR